MTFRLRPFYPALLAVVDLAIGGGLLSVQTASPLGVLMIAVGIVLVGHVAFTVLSRTNSVVSRVVTTGS
jgi:hypothetical protein